MTDTNKEWQNRFKQKNVFWSQIAKANPNRGVVNANIHTESQQLYAWDIPSNKITPVTNREIGMQLVMGTFSHMICPNGNHIYFLDDEDGSEVGLLARVPFKGGAKEIITSDFEPFCTRGMDASKIGNKISLNPVNQENGFQIVVFDLEKDGRIGKPQIIYISRKELFRCYISYDGSIVSTQSTERANGLRHYSTLAIDTKTKDVINELWDGPEVSVEIWGCSPVENKLICTTNKSGFRRPILWDPISNTRHDYDLPELKGDVVIYDFAPDGKSILFNHVHQAKEELCILDLKTEGIKYLEPINGSIGVYADFSCRSTYFASKESIHAHIQSSTHPFRLQEINVSDGKIKRTIFKSNNEPPCTKWIRKIFASSDGQEIQAWVATPKGEGPFPTILNVHGGPHLCMTDSFHPMSQAWVDHGFAFVSLNYRASELFGKDYAKCIWGNIGHWELTDIKATHKWLIDQKISHPQKIIIEGGSYGGYLTLWSLGKAPELWAGGIAAVPLADWKMSFEDAAYTHHGVFSCWHKGTPDEVPENYKNSSALTFADQVQAPVFILTGRYDCRAPLRQVEAYVNKLKANNKKVVFEVFDGGHALGGRTHKKNYNQMMIDFALECVGNKR